MHLPRSVLRAVIRTGVRPVLNDRLSPQRQRRIIDALTRFPVLPRGTRVEASELGGRPADRIWTPGGGTDGGSALLYLHGGAYSVGSCTTHRALAAHLADATGAVSHLLDYRLAPEHPYPAAVDDAIAAYQELLDSGLAADRVVVAGDSAGGGLALALVVRAKAEGIPLPRALALISPWADLTLTGLDDDIADPLLTRAWLERSARDYAGTERQRAEVSPVYADLSGFPAMLVHGTSDEILISDIERFVERAREVGADVTYQRFDGLWHVIHMYAGMNREATDAVRAMGSWLRDRLATPV